MWPQHRRFVEEEPRQRSMMKKVIPIMVPAWTSCELSVRPDRTGTSPPWVGPSAWPQSLHFLRGAKNKSPSPSIMSSTGCRHCFFVFDPTLSSIGMVRLFVIPSGAARSPNHDSAPQGSASVPPPPVRPWLRSLAPAPAPAACSCSGSARTVLIQGGAAYIFPAWLGPSLAPICSQQISGF